MFQIEPLASYHLRDTFDCGEPTLNAYIQNYAGQNLRRDISRTYVAVTPGDSRVLGYCTLSSGTIVLETLPEVERKGLPRILPTVHLGRLAVDRTAQGQGLGDALVYFALRQAVAAADIIGIHAVEVWALTDAVRSYYLRLGFHPLLDDQLHLYLSMKTIRKLAPLVP